MLKIGHKYQFRLPLNIHDFIEILRGSILIVNNIDETDKCNWAICSVEWGLIKETTGESFDIPERYWQYFSELHIQG